MSQKHSESFCSRAVWMVMDWIEQEDPSIRHALAQEAWELGRTNVPG